MTTLIVGGGVSGLGAARFLRKLGKDVRVSDGGTVKPTLRSEFTRIGVQLEDGGHHVSHLNGVDELILSPGIRPDHPLVLEAVSKNIPWRTEIDLALADWPTKVVAVTGTNGKSTTCVMLEHALRVSGFNAAAGGNLGDPPTAMRAENRVPDVLALELSSYQLELTKQLSVDSAVFTSFSHDHIQRHGTLEKYFAAKWRVVHALKENGHLCMPRSVKNFAVRFGHKIPQGAHVIVSHDDSGKPESGEWHWVGKTLLRRDGTTQEIDFSRCRLQEPHNLLNAAMSVLAASPIVGVGPQELANALIDFRGLPHRCEIVGYIAGKAVINDSKSTNVESTLVALDSQAEKVVLLMGGQGKDEPYQEIATRSQKIEKLLTFGASGKRIAADVLENSPRFAVENFPTLALALAAVRANPPSKPILFSPGCASFDEFLNFEDRGRRFADALRPLFDK